MIGSLKKSKQPIASKLSSEHHSAASSASGRAHTQCLTLTEAPGGPLQDFRGELKKLGSQYIRQLVIDCMHELEDRSAAYHEASAIHSSKKKEVRDQDLSSSRSPRSSR